MKPIMYIFFGILINEIFYVFMHGFPFKKKKINSKAGFGLGEEYVCAVVGGEQ